MPTHYELHGTDFIFLCGGGVVGHPKGARAGARSIRQAREAIRQNIPLKQYAKQAPELAQALTALRNIMAVAGAADDGSFHCLPGCITPSGTLTAYFSSCGLLNKTPDDVHSHFSYDL
jgi:hypothetical protein